MICHELNYQQRVHRVCVQLRLRGWSSEEVEMVRDHALYEGEATLVAWEKQIAERKGANR